MPVPELEEADRGVTAIVEVPDPGTDRPVAWPVVEVVLLVRIGIDQVAVPVGQRWAVDPIDPVDAGGIKIYVRQVPARVPGQRRVGVQVHHPVLELEMSQADVDRQGLGELFAPLKVRTECHAHAVPLTDRDRTLVLLGGDDDPVVEKRLVDPDRLLQEVIVMEAHGNGLDSHGKLLGQVAVRMGVAV